MPRKKEKYTESDVLFQKIGNDWFLFTQIGNEIIYTQLPPGLNPKTSKLQLYEVIEEHQKKIPPNIDAA